MESNNRCLLMAQLNVQLKKWPLFLFFRFWDFQDYIFIKRMSQELKREMDMIL